MNNPLIKLLLISLLMSLILAPFAGLAPLMLLILGLGVSWFIWSIVEAFLKADGEKKQNT